MDINKLQLVNTFLKGMNTDSSDSVIPNSQYRYAENIRIVCGQDLNDGEVHLIEGTKLLTLLSATYSDPQIIDITSIRNYVIVILNTSLGWIILRNTNYGETDAQHGYDKIFGPCTTPIQNTQHDRISIVTRWESDNNIKLYIADLTENHSIMCINIADENNVDNPKTDIKYLLSYQSAFIPKAEISVSSTAGQLNPAKVLYTYRLYKLGGGATKLAPLSKVLSLYKSPTQGYASNQKTQRAVDIVIPLIYNTNDVLDHILLYRISYQENGQLPTVTMVVDREIDLSQLTTITDSGAQTANTISVSELLSQDSMEIFPKIIESKNDYLFASGIKYSQDDVDEKFKDIDLISKTSGNNSDNPYLHSQFISVPYKYNEQYWKKPSDATKYGGEGEYIDWEYATNVYDVLVTNFGSYNELYPSLRRDEVYRFGAILYDEDGHRSSVKWIADIMIPPYSSNILQKNTFSSAYGGEDKFTLVQIGIKFTLKRAIPGCSAIEIVRCPRTEADKTVISQGLIGHALKTRYADSVNGTWKEDCVYPYGFISMQQANIHTLLNDKMSTNALNILMFASPEYVYQPSDTKDKLSGATDQLYISHVTDYGIKLNSTNSTYGSFITPTSYGITSGVWFTLNSGTIDWTGNSNAVAPLNASYPFHPIFFSKYINGQYRPGTIYFNYITPSSNLNWSNQSNYENKLIKQLVYPLVPEWDDFAEDLDLKYQDAISIIDGKLFTSWTTPLLAGLDANGQLLMVQYFSAINSDPSNTNYFTYGIGTVGRCILMALDNGISPITSTGYIVPITIANIKRKSVPYGGHTKDAIMNSSYASFGDSVKLDNPTATLYVYDGDCVNLPFKYNAAHTFDHPAFVNAVRLGTVYVVPIESDIDLRATYGDLFDKSRQKYWHQQDVACAFDDYIQEKNAYAYNTAYSQYPNIIQYTSVYYTDISNDNFDTRIHASDLKTNGENIDSWVSFKASNFIDVDSRYGAVTDMRLFKQKLICWQESATSVLSVNDRILLKDSEDSLIVLGTGGILDRYDYITTLYGMKPNQFADAQSNSTLFWWDGYNKEIVGYGGESVLPLSTIKNIKNYIQTHEENNDVTLIYDNKYKELISSVVNGESVVYSENAQAFTSIYKFMPHRYTNTDRGIIMSDYSNIYKYNEQYTPGFALLFSINVGPKVQFVINDQPVYNKTYDITTFGGRFYGGDDLSNIHITYDTPLKQHSEISCTPQQITNLEYDFRLTIPRDSENDNNKVLYGNRMRGKTMQCEFRSSSNSTDFSLQYVTTKYRMSWS